MYILGRYIAALKVVGSVSMVRVCGVMEFVDEDVEDNDDDRYGNV